MSDHREIRALSLYQPWAQAISLLWEPPAEVLDAVASLAKSS
jgi:hypothetical protein